ncbi:ferritin [Putridiphycobacter roseus]|uniref:Ferritin n=1 Tax=Putridiphycobacter roseus TaxID=2219161 RepID=A0A2W1NNV6_9FLAO|nr:ferritin [Putridiphycobacter roseus]PZE16288.1 ferritin [Putridiphycobacter roseus]
MPDKEIEKALNSQIQKEANSSQLYLSMASWADQNGLSGTAQFLYAHSDEERLHMLKLVKFINERGGKAKIPKLDTPKDNFESLEELFIDLLNHEIMVTNAINEIVHICIQKKDYTTHNFMQWFVAEQLEEEALARNVLDKIKLIGNDKGGLYLFDRDIVNMVTTETPGQI